VTCNACGPRFCLYVGHTNALREWICNRSYFIGRPHKKPGEAEAMGWRSVHMKSDRKLI